MILDWPARGLFLREIVEETEPPGSSQSAWKTRRATRRPTGTLFRLFLTKHWNVGHSLGKNETSRPISRDRLICHQT
jgi:hypothetical protein